MFKGFVSKDKIILGLLILVLLGLISLIAFHFKLTDSGLISAKELYIAFQKSLNPSKVNITLEKSDLKVNFKLNSADFVSAETFFKDLGIENSVNQEIDIKLGDSLAIYLNDLFYKNNLISTDQTQISLNLRILSKEIDFDNKKSFGFFDASNENLMKSPSDTGAIRVQNLGEKSYLVEIDNPEKALSEATLSGNLKLSENLINSRWWQVLTKVAKIKVKIESSVLTGTIFLK